MTYSKPKALAYANPRLGPSGITPPFRKYGFHSFQGLGIDRPASGDYSQYVFVTSLHPISGLPAGTASLVPRKIKDALLSVGLRNVDAGWSSGGRLWVRYYVPGKQGGFEGSWGSESYRQKRVREGLAAAASALGPNVTFGLSDGSHVPAGRTPTGTAAENTQEGASVIRSKADSDSTPMEVPVVELQRLLLQKGFSVGSSGADGVWGPATTSAYQRALGGTDPSVNVSSDRRTVTVWKSHLDAIKALPDNPTPSPTRTAPTRAPAEPPADMMPEGVPLKAWLPWTAGAVALLGVGGYFLYKGKKRKVAANRRRRRRRRRRTSRRR